MIGEGAATLVLEEYEHAKARGATIYAEIVGYGAANDFKHIAIPSVEGQAATMAAAMKNSGLNTSDIQYINAHGTGTKFNDAVSYTHLDVYKRQLLLCNFISHSFKV